MVQINSSGRLVGKFFCNDCKVDVVAIGDWYMCQSEVWEQQLGLGWSDNLCLACLTKRLGHEPKFLDDVVPASTGSRGKDAVKPSERMMQIWDTIPGLRRTRLKK